MPIVLYKKNLFCLFFELKQAKNRIKGLEIKHNNFF